MADSNTPPHTLSEWRTGFGPDEVIQRVRPNETDAWLPNPHRGTTTFQRFNGDPLFPGLIWNDKEGPTEFKPFDGNLKNPQYPDTTISYCRWVWNVIEPEKGKFRWDIIDAALEAARQRGQTLQVRIQPFVGDTVPEWYWALGARQDKAMSRPDYRVPDHNDALYVKHWSDIIRAFGRRYDGHPVLESFDIAYGGACGEMGGNTSKKNSIILADAYMKAFRKTQLVMMLETEGGTYAAAKDKRIGWRGDCYGDVRLEGRAMVPEGKCWNHMYDCYPKAVELCGVSEQWRTAPVTLETCWTVGHWYKEGWDIDWIIEQGYKYHLSVFMPKSSYFPEAVRDKMDRFNNRIGYRYTLRQMLLPLETERGARIKVEVWIDNVGVAPIYRPYKFAYRFRQGKSAYVVQSKQDITKWMPDHTWFAETVKVPPALQRGTADVDVALVDAATDTPKVWFAIEDKLPDGWHPMTTIDVI